MKWFLIIFFVTSFACKAELDWTLQQELDVPAGEFNLLQISNNPTIFDIKIEADNHHDFFYKSLFNRDGTESILLPFEKVDSSYKIYFKYHSLINNKQHIQIRTLKDLNEIAFFKLLTELSYSYYINSTEALNAALLTIKSFDLKAYSHKQESQLRHLSDLFLYQLGQYQTIITEHQVNNDYDKYLDSYLHIQWLKSLSYLNLGIFDKAIKSFQNTLNEIDSKTNLSTPWQLNKAEIQAYLGLSLSLNYFHRQAQTADGYTEINAALNTANALSDDQLVSEVLYLLGSYYSAKQQWLETIATLDIALEYINKAQTKDNLVGIYNQKAIAHRQLNQYAKSLDNYREAINHIPAGDRNTKANVYNNIAAIYEFLGDLNKAKRYFENSLNEYVVFESLYGQAMAKKALGRIYRKQNNYAKAIELHQQSIEYFKQDKESSYLETYIELSMDYYANQEFATSEIIAIKVLLLSHISNLSQHHLDRLKIKKDQSYSALFKQLSAFDFETLKEIFYAAPLPLNKEYEYRALIILSMIEFKKPDDQFLIKTFDLLENGISENRVPIQDQLDVYLLKMRHFDKTNNDEKFNQLALKAFNLINQTRSKLDVSDLGLYWSQQANILLENYNNALIKKGQHQTLFEQLEKYNSINLRHKRQQSLDSQNNQHSLTFQQALENYLDLERQSILENDKSLQTQADEAKERFLALNVSSDKNNEIMPIDNLSIKQVQDKLESDELILRYYINNKNALVYVISQSAYEVISIPDINSLNLTVKEFLDNIKTKQLTKLSKSNVLLSKIVPLDKLTSGTYKKLIVVPDGILNLLPFDALNLSQNTQDYIPLALNINVERTYSLSDYFMQVNMPANADIISVFANPVFLKNTDNENTKAQFSQDNKLWEFEPLPFSELEANHIQDIFINHTVNLLTGKNATNDNFMSDQTRNSNIIHIASHGFFNESNLEEVGIATSILELDEHGKEVTSAGILAMREVLYKPFKANLVVISGCETTLGKHISGEGFNSLSRGLLSQGVGSVIGTIWSISDRATPIFMQEFYTNLKSMNGNVSKALNTTKVNFATQPKFRRYRHPYYWAGFVLTTSSRQISENIF